MGRVSGGDFATPLGALVRVLNVEREDGNDVMLALSMVDAEDDRHVEVLLSNGNRWQLINSLMRDDEKAWGSMSPHQLLAEAQDWHEIGRADIATLLTAVAQVQATAMLDWTLSERVTVALGNR